MIKDHLTTRISDEYLTNVKLLPLQPRDEYYNIIKSSDINLISLDKRMKAPCLPGKTMNLFAAGKPVLAIVGRDSEMAYVMDLINTDLIIQPGDIRALKNTILRLKNDLELREYIGTKQKKFFEDKMILEKNCVIYEQIFHHLLRDGTHTVKEST
jgi:colanic acid biosynthesis glycosyl transferase WcaI